MPIPVLTVSQMRQWEKAAWADGCTEADVIRRVGESVARCALEMTRRGEFILILAGKGNNGADARATIEHLKERRVELMDVSDANAAMPLLAKALSRRPKLVVDGLFGIGLNRSLDADWLALVNAVNASSCAVLAIDTPSGLNADSGEAMGGAIRAATTITVGAPKIGLLKPGAAEFVGRLEVANDVGLSACLEKSELNWTLPGDFEQFPPRRPVASHKGTFGHVALIAGSFGFHGAAVLAARGAQRAQPGLITLFVQEAVYVPVASQCQGAMVSIWNPALSFPGKFSAVLVGPGLAATTIPDELKLSVRQLWRDAPVPVIADASALDWLPLDSAPSHRSIRVVTPHPGEAARLLKSTPEQVLAHRADALREITKRLGGCVVVLKGHQTLVGRAGEPLFVNPSGNAFLAQGGSGDLLAGFLAGLLAQPSLQSDPLKTIRYAVWQHGQAADVLNRQRAGWSVEDLAAVLGARVD